MPSNWFLYIEFVQKLRSLAPLVFTCSWMKYFQYFRIFHSLIASCLNTARYVLVLDHQKWDIPVPTFSQQNANEINTKCWKCFLNWNILRTEPCDAYRGIHTLIQQNQAASLHPLTLNVTSKRSWRVEVPGTMYILCCELEPSQCIQYKIKGIGLEIL